MSGKFRAATVVVLCAVIGHTGALTAAGQLCVLWSQPPIEIDPNVDPNVPPVVCSYLQPSISSVLHDGRLS